MKKRTVISRIKVHAGKEQDYISLVEPIIERTKEEPGTLAYFYYRNMYDPTEFLAYEEYAGQEGFDAHCAGEPFQNFKAKVGPMLAKEIDTQIFE